MKVSIFLGRIHHFLKLQSIISNFVDAGDDVQIILARNSINIDPATEYLHKYNITSYNYASDYIDLAGVERINSMTEQLMNFSVDPKLNSTVPPFWIASSIREAAEDIVGFEQYLKISNPDVVLALHEQNFFVKILFYLAQQKGIQTFSLQEGIILVREEDILHRYSSGTAYTNKLFSWSDYDRAFYSDPSKIIPAGPPHLDEWILLRENLPGYLAYKIKFRKTLDTNSKAPLITFMPPRLDLYKGDFVADFTGLSEWTRNKGISLVLRLHPFQAGPFVQQLKDSFLDKYAHVRAYDNPDGIPCIAGSDVIVTQTSTVELEAIALGVPVVEIDTGYNGLEQPLWKHGAATLVERDEFNKIGDVLQGKFDIDAVNEFRKDRLALADGYATQRIINHVKA